MTVPEEERHCPNPLLWLWYQYGGTLPARHRAWVLHDATAPSWLLRAGLRSLMRLVPVVLVLLNLTGGLSARGILRGWRIAVLGVAVFTAAVTPSADVLSMVLLAVPMIALYFAAAGVAAVHDRRVARAQRRYLDAPALLGVDD